MMKRIGIITFFYNAINYGANLQAYALCQYLNKNGMHAEQIRYDKRVSKFNSIILKRLFSKGVIEFFACRCRKFENIINRFSKKRNSVENNKYQLVIQGRKEAFLKFQENVVCSSKKVYNLENIHECIDDYDIFITGSDQVWNEIVYYNPYFLDFVPEKKIKISYAASRTRKEVKKCDRKILRNSLDSFDAISVREKNTVVELQKYTDKQVQMVLDPTLLLEKGDWEEICARRQLEDEYVFCYFLGENITAMELAITYAKTKNKKLVNIPYASGVLNEINFSMGDVQFENASPQEFLSLIKYASCVFTDSFHAVVFSIIYQTQFFIFNRNAEGTMNSRIINLTDMFDLQRYFCGTKDRETIEYIESVQAIDYSTSYPKFEKCRQESYEFIRENIFEKERTEKEK